VKSRVGANTLNDGCRVARQAQTVGIEGWAIMACAGTSGSQRGSADGSMWLGSLGDQFWSFAPGFKSSDPT